MSFFYAMLIHSLPPSLEFQWQSRIAHSENVNIAFPVIVSKTLGYCWKIPIVRTRDMGQLTVDICPFRPTALLQSRWPNKGDQTRLRRG